MPTELAAPVVLLVAGASLAAVAVVRLTGRGLTEMPRAVAVGALIVGAGVSAGAYAVRPRPPALELSSASPGPAVLRDGIAGRLPLTPAASVGIVSGHVLHPDRSPLPGATVTLRRFERTDEVWTSTAITGGDGAFRFADLPVGPTTVYTAATDFEGTIFRSGLLFPGLHAAEAAAELVVAPTTQDPKTVSYESDSTVVVGDARGAQVVQIVRVRNDTDRAYVGGIRLPLLPGATGLDPRAGLDRTRLLADDGELVSMAPVLPGVTEVVYEYAAPLARSGVRLRRTVAHPTRTFTLLTDPRLRVQASGMHDDGRVRVGRGEDARTYGRHSAHSLQPGDRLRADVRAGEPNTALRAAAVGAGIAVAAGAVMFPIVRRRRVPRAEPPPAQAEAEQARLP